MFVFQYDFLCVPQFRLSLRVLVCAPVCVVLVPVPWAPASACFKYAFLCEYQYVSCVAHRACFSASSCASPRACFSLWSGTCSSASFCVCRRKYFSACSLACSIARSYTGSIIEKNGAKNVQERKLEKDEREMVRKAGQHQISKQTG